MTSYEPSHITTPRSQSGYPDGFRYVPYTKHIVAALTNAEPDGLSTEELLEWLKNNFQPYHGEEADKHEHGVRHALHQQTTNRQNPRFWDYWNKERHMKVWMLVNKAHSADSHTRSVEKPFPGGRRQSHSMFLQPQRIRMSGAQSGSPDDSIASRLYGEEAGHESYDQEDQVRSAVQEPSARVGRETQALTSLEPTTTTETRTDQQNQTTSPPPNADKAAAPIDGGDEPLRAEAVAVSVSIADPVNQEDRNDLEDMKILRKLQDHKKERDGRKRWIQIHREGRPDIELLKENQRKAEAEAAEKARIAEQARLASEAARKELDDALANEHRVVVQMQKLLELAEESKRLRVQLGIEDDLGE